LYLFKTISGDWNMARLVILIWDEGIGESVATAKSMLPDGKVHNGTYLSKVSFDAAL
jgi:hypothetical protein